MPNPLQPSFHTCWNHHNNNNNNTFIYIALFLFLTNSALQDIYNLTSHRIINKGCETGPPVYRPYPRRLESLTICRSSYPPVPNPILELVESQTFSLFPRIPILALEKPLLPAALNPSLLQLACKDTREPISVFHVLRPSDVARYFPSAISAYSELACLLMTRNLIC